MRRNRVDGICLFILFFPFGREQRGYLFSDAGISEYVARKKDLRSTLLHVKRKTIQEHEERISSIELMSHSWIYGKIRNSFYGSDTHWEFG